MINELIEQIGERERLEAIVYAMGAEPCDADPILDSVTHGDIGKMARALLAVLDAQEKPAGEPSLASIDNLELELGTKFHTIPPAASVPDGWKLVPLKAFPSQWAAGQKAFDAAGINKIDPVYHAMVEAAPAPGGE